MINLVDSAIHLLNNQAQAHRKELESERTQMVEVPVAYAVGMDQRPESLKNKVFFQEHFSKKGVGAGGEGKGGPPVLTIPTAMTTHTEKFQVLN